MSWFASARPLTAGTVQACSAKTSASSAACAARSATAAQAASASSALARSSLRSASAAPGASRSASRCCTSLQGGRHYVSVRAVHKEDRLWGGRLKTLLGLRTCDGANHA